MHRTSEFALPHPPFPALAPSPSPQLTPSVLQTCTALLNASLAVMQREEEEQQAAVDAKLEQQRMQASFLETTGLQLTDLQQRGDAAATEAQQCQAAIRGKADVAKQEREK